MVRRSTLLAIGIAACAQPAPPERVPLPPPVRAEAPALPPDTPVETAPPPSPPSKPLPPPHRPGAYANVDPDDDFVVGPPDRMEDCEGALARSNVKFHAALLAVHTEKKSKMVCGAPQVVTYLRGPGNIAYSSPPLLTCTMALALASFENILQEEARRLFNSPVVRIDHLGTYNCREMAAYKGWVSEHSYANAIDLERFVLKDGRSVEVLRDFDASNDTPKRPAGVFLRNVSRRANDEDVFSHVLTPFFDALHKNHFHLDLARYRTDGTRPQG
jgi:hypothetical protein